MLGLSFVFATELGFRRPCWGIAVVSGVITLEKLLAIEMAC